MYAEEPQDQEPTGEVTLTRGGPAFPPPARLALYFVACVATVLVGLVPTGIIAAAWSVARYGTFSPDVLLQSDDIATISSLVGIYPLLAGVTILFARFIDRGSLARIGLARERLARQVAVGAVAGVLFVAVGTGLYVALGWEHLVPVPASPGLILFASILLYPLIGVAEELIFRGYLLANLDEWLGRSPAIAVSAILFWAVHIGQGNVTEPLGVGSFLAMGVLLALMRYGTGALWAPIGFHAAYDWAAVTFTGGAGTPLPTLYQPQVTAPSWLVGPPGESGLADLLLMLLLLGVVYWFVYRRRAAVLTALPGAG